jgi:hypothetical protein
VHRLPEDERCTCIPRLLDRSTFVGRARPWLSPGTDTPNAELGTQPR